MIPKGVFGFVLGLGVVGLGLTVLTPTLSGRGFATEGQSAESEEAFWDTLRIQGDQVEDYDSFQDMMDAADIVAIVSMDDFKKSRDIRDPATREDVVTYAAVEVTLEEVLRGDASPGDVLPVEFVLGQPPEQAAQVIAAQRRNLPPGRAIVFLRAKRGRGERGLYRLVCNSGLWVEAGREVSAPLATTAASVETAASETLLVSERPGRAPSAQQRAQIEDADKATAASAPPNFREEIYQQILDDVRAGLPVNAVLPQVATFGGDFRPPEARSIRSGLEAESRGAASLDELADVLRSQAR